MDNYTERSSSAGGTIGIGMPSMVSASKGKTDSTYASVTGQSGIFAGNGGFDINVGGNTDLTGAVIASTATPDKNTLSTDTLTFSDIQNKADYSASSTGFMLKDGFIKPNSSIPVSGNSDSTTHSAVSPGTIIVGGLAVNPTNLSRDTNNSLNALGKIFDKKTVEEQQELVNLFAQEAYHAVGDLKLKEDSTEKVAIDTALGGIISLLGGGNFASGAASSGFTQLIMNQLANIHDPTILQLVTYAVGAAAGKVAGGNAQLGGSIALSQVQNNWLSHPQQKAFMLALAHAKSDYERQQITAYFTALSEWQEIYKPGGGDATLENDLLYQLNQSSITPNPDDISKGLNYNLVAISAAYGLTDINGTGGLVGQYIDGLQPSSWAIGLKNLLPAATWVAIVLDPEIGAAIKAGELAGPYISARLGGQLAEGAETIGSSRIPEQLVRGQQFEGAVLGELGLAKNTEKIGSSIPDAILADGTIVEIKDVIKNKVSGQKSADLAFSEGYI